jgi:hypothetical protein
MVAYQESLKELVAEKDAALRATLITPPPSAAD